MDNAGEAHGEHIGATSEDLVRLQSPAPTIREQFNRDGYLVIKNRRKKWTVSWTEDGLKEDFSKGDDYYISFLSAATKSVMLQELFLEKRILDTLSKIGMHSLLLSGQPVLHVMSPNLRIVDGYYGTAPHQDWPSIQGSLDMVTVWIALTDVSKYNFPLEIMPGSHLGGLREGVVNGSVLEIPDVGVFTGLECKAGDVVVMSGFLVHRTGKGTGFRIAVSQRFENAAEPTFIERGYPCAQKRIVERGVKWKPTVEQIRGIYGVG